MDRIILNIEETGTSGYLRPHCFAIELSWFQNEVILEIATT